MNLKLDLSEKMRKQRSSLFQSVSQNKEFLFLCNLCFNQIWKNQVEGNWKVHALVFWMAIYILTNGIITDDIFISKWNIFHNHCMENKSRAGFGGIGSSIADWVDNLILTFSDWTAEHLPSPTATLASHASVLKGAHMSSLSTNACSTENNIPFPLFYLRGVTNQRYWNEVLTG